MSVHEVAGVLSALLLNLVGGVLVFKRFGRIEPLAWVAFGAVAFGQVGLHLQFSGPEPWAGLKYFATNIAIGLVIAMLVRSFYKRIDAQ